MDIEIPADASGVRKRLAERVQRSAPKLHVGVQEQQYVTFGRRCTRIHLNRTAARADQHPGISRGDLNGPVGRSAVDDDDLIGTELTQVAQETCYDGFLLVHGNDHRDSWRLERGLELTTTCFGHLVLNRCTSGKAPMADATSGLLHF